VTEGLADHRVDHERGGLDGPVVVTLVDYTDDRAGITALKLQAMNEVETIVPIGREVQHGEEKVAVGERFQGLLDGTHENTVVTAVANNVDETLPYRSVSPDDEDPLMVHAPP